MEAIVLAGGLGTRLRAVCPDLPKPMAPVAGRPFLEHLLAYWNQQGVRRYVLSVGYKHEVILAHFRGHFGAAGLRYAIETAPLGTGGGVLYAAGELENRDNPFLLLNGDTFFAVSLADYFAAFERSGASCGLAVFQVADNSRYGGIVFDERGVVEEIRNAPNSGPAWINGGCYLLRLSCLKEFSGTTAPFSFEAHILPKLVARRECFAFPVTAPFIDIGIPSDYARADQYFPSGVVKV